MPVDAPKLILASRSPRRKQLLAEAGYQFDIVPAAESVECGICSRESPAEMVARAEEAYDLLEHGLGRYTPPAS